jgi:hypothetical protein
MAFFEACRLSMKPDGVLFEHYSADKTPTAVGIKRNS